MDSIVVPTDVECQGIAPGIKNRDCHLIEGAAGILGGVIDYSGTGREEKCQNSWQVIGKNSFLFHPPFKWRYSLYPHRNKKKDWARQVCITRNPFRQTGARHHSVCVPMMKVTLRQTPKSVYGAQIREIYR